MSTWSLSRLGTFEKCQAQYKYRYIDQIPTPKSTSAQRGIDTHKIVEDFLLGNVPSLPDELSFYSQFLTSLKNAGVHAEIKLGVDRSWSPVSWDNEAVWGRAVLDALHINGSVANVYDWKTGKPYPEHDDQKELYAAFVFSNYPEVQRVNSFHTYLDSRKTIPKVFDRPDLTGIVERWTDRVRRMEEAQMFIPNPTFSCTYCPFSRAKGGPCRF